jgi:tetratricopeptide (TPR) repeat protein
MAQACHPPFPGEPAGLSLGCPTLNRMDGAGQCRVSGLAVLTLLVPATADAKWQRLDSPGFQLYTDAGARRGTEVLKRLERIRGLFRVAPRAARGDVLPARVYLFSSEAQYRAYGPAEYSPAFYQSAAERDSIVMRVSDELDRAPYHEYVHLALHHSTGPLPKWFEEGLAEFYSSIDIGPKNVLVGAGLPVRLAALESGRWLTADELAAVDKDSPYYNERSKAGLFYAQSWALTHMLSLSPAYRKGMPHFWELLDRGEPQLFAFEQAFGKPLSAAIEDLHGYLRLLRLPTAALRPDEPVSAPEIRVRDLSPTEADLALAELAVDTQKPDEAERIYRRLARGDPDSPEVQTGLGALALNKKQYDEARRHFERAIALGSTRADTHFEYAMLLRESGGSTAEVAVRLRRAVELNPNFAEAHFLLGVMASNEKRYEEAVIHLEAAASIFPRQSYFWHALAIAYHQLQRPDDARQAARRALQSAATQQEAEMAEAALRLTAEQSKPVEKGPVVAAPDSWKPRQGDARIEGALMQIDCLGSAARVHVKGEHSTIALYVQDPGQVTLRNLSSVNFEFRCGPQDGRSVVIEYVSKPDAQTATVGVVTAIEFR